MEFFTGGGCGGNCASAAGPATSRTAIVTTDMRSIIPPEGTRPMLSVAKLSHNFPVGVSARVGAKNLFWTPEADLLHAGEACGMGVRSPSLPCGKRRWLAEPQQAAGARLRPNRASARQPSRASLAK